MYDLCITDFINIELNSRIVLLKFDQKKHDFFPVKYTFIGSRSLVTVAFAGSIRTSLRAFLKTATFVFMLLIYKAYELQVSSLQYVLLRI